MMAHLILTTTKRLVSILSTIVIALATLLSASSDALGQSANNDWVGWAYFDAGMDMPLRIGLPDPSHGGPATFDHLVARRFNDSITSLEWTDSTVRIVYDSPHGTHIVFNGARSPTTISGRIQWGEDEASFELNRSPRPLPDINPNSYADCEGIYRSDAGHVFQVTARFWGEIIFTERQSGLRRTLFPMTDSTFFAGSALYVPDPIAGDVHFHRSPNGDVTGLTWLPNGEAPRVAQRIEMSEEDVSFSRDGVTFHGTLIKPVSADKQPAIVLLGGSSWQQRNSTRSHAVTMASMGLAALIYDKRGYGESGGDQTVPFSVTADDALAAVDYLRSRDDIQSDHVGLLGVSRGGWFAPLAASRSDNVGFMILLVPPAVSPAVQETHSRLDQMRAAGYGEFNIIKASKLLDETWEFVRTGQNWDSYWVLWQLCRQAEYPGYLFEPEVPDSAEWQWSRMNMFYDPLPALKKVTCPVLAIFGEKDLKVSARVNRPLMEQALREAGMTDFEMHTMPGVGHNLIDSDDLPLHRKTGRGDRGYSIIAEWVGGRFR